LFLFLFIGAGFVHGQAPSGPAAFYADLQPDTFLTEWLVIGPFPVSEDTGAVPDEAIQQQAFGSDPLVKEFIAVSVGQAHQVDGQEYRWQVVTADADVVDLDKVFDGKDFVSAYARADLELPEATSVLMALGSDDGVKVWLNGEVVHENWVARPVNKDEDLFPMDFRKGRNTILIKVQDRELDWGFCLRPIGPDLLRERFVQAAGAGDLDLANLLLAHGVDINATVNPGLTALHSARIHGRDDMVTLLQERGADAAIPMPAAETLADVMMRKAISDEVPGAAVLIARDSKILYRKGFGLADVGNCVPVTPETKFRIGSVTKQFTAAAILKLQEAGLLNVQDPIAKYLPEYPRGDEVTIHHLLTHTSGIHSFTEKPNFMETVTVERTSEEMVDWFKADSFDFNPGEQWHYNNSGYFLLGYIIENISGKSYGEYLKEALFDPLGMHDTGVHNSHDILENEAYGYSYIDGTFQKALDWDMSQAGGAGALYSTVLDLYRWNEAVFGGEVLTEESLQAAFTPVTLNDGTVPRDLGAGYGYGWIISEFRGQQEINHSGGLQGFVSYLTRLPGINATVTVLHNCIPARDISPDAAAHELTEIFFWEDLAQQASVAVADSIDVSEYDDYAGQYEYPMGAIMQIAREGERLYAQLGGQSRYQIFPYARDEFFWKVTDARISFVRNEAGEVVAAIHRQGGGEFRAPRVEEEIPAEIDFAVYSDLTGEYEISPAVVITVTTDGAHLFAQATNQAKIEIFPRSESEYFYKIIRAEITFIRGADGRVTELVLNQAGAKHRAKKIR